MALKGIIPISKCWFFILIVIHPSVSYGLLAGAKKKLGCFYLILDENRYFHWKRNK